MKLLLTIVLALLVLGGGVYLMLPHGEDPAGSTGPARTETQADEGVERETNRAQSDDAPDDSLGMKTGADADRPAAPRGGRKNGPNGGAHTISKPAPIELIAVPEIPVRIQRGAESTVLRGCVLTPGGDPLASAIVLLFQVATSSTGINPLRPPERVRVAEAATTDAKGCFRFAHLDGGRGYIVRVEHGSYAPSERGDVDVAATGETALPDLRMAPGAALFGTITDEGKEPLEGALVAAYALQPMPGLVRDVPVRQMLTDDAGNYALENLALGDYVISIAASGKRSLRSRRLALTAANQRLRTDLELEPGLTLRGRVMSDAKEPVAGATVEARSRSNAGSLVARTVTRENGAFELEGLGPEELRLDAKAKGFAPGYVVPATPGQVEITVIHVVANLGITGFVLDESTEKPITSFGIMLWMIGKGDTLNEAHGEMRVVERSLDGSYTIEDVPPGNYRVQAFANDYGPTFTKTFVVKNMWVNGVVVKLGHGASVVGRVVTPDGKPIVGAQVRMFDNAYTRLPISKMLYGDMAEPTKPVTSDAEGNFRFEHLGAGAVQLRVAATGRMPLIRRDVVVGETGETDVGALTLGEGGTVIGAIIDSTGAIARSAKVMLQSKGGETDSTKTDANGEYRFEHVTPGEYSISAEPAIAEVASSNPLISAIAIAKATKSVIVEDGRTIRMDIQLVKLQ